MTTARPIFQGPLVHSFVTTPEERAVLSAWLGACSELDLAKDALKRARAELRRAEAAKRVATAQWRESLAGLAYNAAFDVAWNAHLQSISDWEKSLPASGAISPQRSAINPQ